MLTIGDLIYWIPEIANFKSQIPILRLPNDNFIKIKGDKYELRLFSFYTKDNEEHYETFADFVKFKNLTNDEIKIYREHVNINPNVYHIMNDNIYLLISILKVEQNHDYNHESIIHIK